MSSTRILIVDDEAIFALDVQQRLVGLGYPEPDLASSGEEAISRALTMQPDLVLMDIKMPGKIDGIEAANRIRSHLDIPVIFVTAHADDDTLRRARITEPYGYLVKPLEEKDLHVAIEIAIHKHHADKRLRESHERFSTTLRSVAPLFS